MTTRIETPADDEAFPTDTPTFDNTGRTTSRAQMMFSPTSSATMGQFDTESDNPRC